MMPVLIQGPKQSGNDIDVYLKPLVDELLELCAIPGVRVWDEHKQMEFDLRALGHAWGRLGAGSPPSGVLLALDLFLYENNSRKFLADSEKLPRTTFLKQKDSRKQELALGILLIAQLYKSCQNDIKTL